nr:MAG TPA: protein of unknown function DUF765 [Caudoviricetes sp.]
MLIFVERIIRPRKPQKRFSNPPLVGVFGGLTNTGSGDLLVAKHHDPEQSAKPPGRWT